MVSFRALMGKVVECISPSTRGEETVKERKDQPLTRNQRKKQKKKEKKKQQQQSSEVIKNQEIAKEGGSVRQEGDIGTERGKPEESNFSKRSETQPRHRCDTTRSEQSAYESRRDDEYYYPNAVPPNPNYYEEPLRRYSSVPANIYRETDPPNFGPTRKWSSVPASMDVTGVTGGSVDTSYATGIANGHQGNVVVQVHPPEGHSNAGSTENSENKKTNDLRRSTISDESDDQSTLRRFMPYYWNVIESSLETLAKLLLLFVVLPTFGFLAIHEVGTESPQLIFGILLTTIIIARYNGGSKKIM